MTCIWHGEWPVIPHRVPLIIKPRRWQLSDGFPWVFIKKLIPLAPYPFLCSAIDETLAPDADNAAGDYSPETGSTRWEMLEIITEDDNVIFNGGTLGGPAAQQRCSIGFTAVSPFEVSFANPVGVPGPSACQRLRWRFRQRKLDSGGQWFPGQIDVNEVQLRETTTQRDLTDPGEDIGTSYVTTTVTLTDAELDAIGNHDNVRIRWSDVDTCADDGLDGGPTIMIAWAQLLYEIK